jgi:hypothetical protein
MSLLFNNPVLMAFVAILLEGTVMIPAAFYARRQGRKTASIFGVYAVLAILTLFVCVVILPLFQMSMSSAFGE